MISDLNLILKKKRGFKKVENIMGEHLQYLFKLETPHIALILINIYMVNNQDIEDG